MSNSLNFKQTLTVSQFKTECGTASIDIVRNPKTEKLFASDDAGNSIAAVSEKAVDAAELVVSLVAGDDGKEFYLIHPKGSAGNNVERSL